MVANGEAWVDQKVIQLLADRCPGFDLDWVGSLVEREQTVLYGVIDGLSNRKIGDKIGVTESTIKGVLQRLFSKTGVRTRTQLVRIALEASSRSHPKAGIQAS
jgi:DNA-binding NarL/FixJ family response regulator